MPNIGDISDYDRQFNQNQSSLIEDYDYGTEEYLQEPEQDSGTNGATVGEGTSEFYTDYSDYYTTSKSEDKTAVKPTVSPEPEAPDIFEQRIQSAQKKEEETIKDFAKMYMSHKLPYIAKGDYSDQPSADPRVLQDNFQSGWADWADSFIQKINEVQRSRDVSNFADVQNKIDEIDSKLTGPHMFPEEQRRKLINDRREAQFELDVLRGEIEEHDKKIAEKEQTLPYQIKKEAARADEGTGNPFIPSQYGIGTFLKYEAPETAAGGFFDWTTQLGAALGPRLISKIGTKALAALGLTGPWGMAANAALFGLSAATGGYALYKMREHESEAEAGEAYKGKLARSTQEFINKEGRKPTEGEARQLRMSSYEGLDALKEANKTLLIEDGMQTAMLAIPWFGNLGKAFGPAALRRAVAGSGSIVANGFSEAIEESNQYIWQEKYKDGTLEDITNLKESLSTYWDASTRSVNAILGIGEQEMTESKEWGNAVRAGAIMGGSFSAANSVAANFRDVLSRGRTNKTVKGLMELESEAEKDAYRAQIISKFMGRGRRGPRDKVSDLIYGRDRSGTFIELMDNLKSSKFAKDNDISNEQIESEKAAFEAGVRVFRKAQDSKYIRDLDDAELAAAATTMANLNKRFSESRDKENERGKDLSEIRSKITGSAEDLGSGFTDLLELKTKSQALNKKYDELKNLEERDIPHVKSHAAKYREKLIGEIRDTENKYKEQLGRSKFSAKDVQSSYDEELREVQGKLFDAKADKEIHQEEYKMLLRSPKELSDRAKGIAKTDEEYREKSDQQAEEALTELQVEESRKATPPEEFLSSQAQETEQIPELDITEEQVDEYVDNKARELQTRLFGSTEATETATAEATTSDFTSVEPRTKGDAEQEIIESYANYNLTNSAPQTVFESKNTERVPAVFQGRVGTLEADRENNTLKFVDVDGNENNLAGLDSTVPTKDLGVTVLNSSLFDISIGGAGQVLNIEGDNYTIPKANPFDTIQYDRNGYPQTVTLLDESGNEVTFENSSLVNEISAALSLIEYAKSIALSYIKQGNEDFVVVKDPDSDNEYAVYQRAGKVHVKGKGSGNSFNRWVKPSQRKNILNIYNNELQRNISSIVDGKRISTKISKQDLKDELRELNDVIRAATPAEINVTKSAAELSDTEGAVEERVPQTAESRTGDQTVTTGIEQKMLGDKARERAEEIITSEQYEEPVENTEQAGLSYVELHEATKHFGPYDRSLSDPSSTLAYYGESQVQGSETNEYYNELDQYATNNNLTNHSIEFEIDYDYTPFWNEHTKLKEQLQSKESFTEEEVTKFIEDNLEEDSSFFNTIDHIPIKAKVLDRDGNHIHTAHIHVSSYDNIQIPSSIDQIEDQTERSVEITKFKDKKKRETRHKRIQVLKSILKGNVPRVEGINRSKGIPVYAPLKSKGRNKKLTEVFPESAREMSIGIADNIGIIYKANGQIMPGTGTPGNVFLETTHTVNGEAFNVKLNPAKLSKEHARVLLKAIATAHLKGGYNAVYPGNEVQGLTAGQTINTLTTEGIKYTKYNPGDPSFKKDTQLYVENKELVFGQNRIDLRNKSNLKDFSKDEIDQFVEWATSYKNYSAKIGKLGTTFKNSFTIGDIKVEANKTTYEEFLIDNGLVLTDLRKPYFHAPVLIWDINNLTEGHEVAESVMGKEYPTDPKSKEEPVKEEQPEAKTTQSKSKNLFKTVESAEDVQALQSGTVLSTRYDSDQIPQPIVRVDDNNKVEVLMEGFNAVVLDPIKGKSIISKESAQEIIDHLKETFPSSDIGYLYNQDVTEDFDNSQNNPDNAFDDPNEISPFRLRDQAPEQYERINIEKEINWLKRKLPNEQVHIVDSLIKVIASGEEAFGQTRSDMIILSRAAEYGTAFHEAFHRVSLSLLTPGQRREVYEKARRKYDMEQASDQQVEEVLAERFREFVLSDSKEKFREPNAIKRLFQRIWDIIRTLFTGDVKLNSLEIERLFYAIEQGRFKFARPKPRNKSPILKGSQAYLNSKGYNPEMQRNIIKNLVFYALTLNGVQRIEDVQNINFEAVQEEIRRKRAAMQYNSEYFGNLASKANTQKQIDYYEGQKADADRLEGLYQHILDDFNHYQSLAEEYLNSMNITRSKEDYLEYEYSGGKGQSEFEKYNKTPFQFDGRDNIRSDIKMLVMTLPESKEKDYSTGMHKFVDFTPTWNKILYDFHDTETVTELMDKLETKAANFVPYQVLHKRLNQYGEDVKTQFHYSVKLHKNNFINLYFDDRGKQLRINFGDAEIRSAERSYAREWGQRLATSNLISKGRVDLEKMKRYNQSYNNMIKEADRVVKTRSEEDFEQLIEGTYKLLNRVSIPMDRDRLLYILDRDETAASRYEALKSFLGRLQGLFSNKGTLYQAALGSYPTARGEKVENSELLLNEEIVRDIGGYFAEYNPAVLSSTILGPKGNPHYKYMANNHMTDTIRRLKRSQDLIELYRSPVFNKHSYFLNKLATDPNVRQKFNIDTFSAFVRSYMDQGRSYEGVNNVEDFIARLHSTKNNKLPLPTLADRSSFYYYSGISPIDFSFNIDDQGNTMLPRNSEIIGIVEGYIIDEQNRIQQTVDQIEEALETGDTQHLVEGYHYEFSNSRPSAGQRYIQTGRKSYKVFTDESGNYIGNGTKYNHFDHLNGKRNIDTNKEARNVVIQSILDTIKLASDLGVITTTKQDKKLLIDSNKFIDSNLVESVAKERYGGNQVAAIKDIIANYAVNNIVSTVETDKVFLSDPAFYENDADKVKRSTVLAATGNNLRTDFPAEHPLYNQTTYNSITLDTRELESVYLPQLKANYVKQLISQGYSESEANRLAEDKLNNYRKVDQTDAQVLVSPEMYKSLRQRMGEWHSKDERTQQSLNSEAEPLKENVMPPLKLTYFGPSFEHGLAIPIYNKMSMAVLDRQTVAGTELEQLLDRMELKGDYAPGNSKNPNGTLEKVHQVKFDTATKVGNRERFQFYADDAETQVNDLSQAPVYREHFDYLRRQTITEPHQEAHIALGTQVKKVPMYNVQKAGNYTLQGKQIFGEELLRVINKSLGTLSNIGKYKLFNKIGIDPETGQVRDATKLLEILREDAERSDSPSNIIQALTPDENGNYVEFDSLPSRQWIENRVVSLVNKYIIDLMVPGKAFIQMSNFGHRRLSAKSIDQFRDKITWLQVAKRDQRFYRVEEEGGLEPMDAVVSVSMFSKVIPNYKNLTFEQKKRWIEKLSPQLMGYRVPTQGPNSVASLRVTGILPESYGDTIVLPAEFTTLTGSDFDIDKLFTMRYNYEKDAEGNPVKTPFLTDSKDKPGTVSTLDQRIDKYAREVALAEDIADINRSYAKQIKKVVRSKELSKEQLDSLRYDLYWLDDYLDTIKDEELEEEVVNKREVVDSIHSLIQDYNKGIQEIRNNRDSQVNELVNKWVEKHRDEFANRPIEEQNTPEALENILFDSYTSILTDPKHAVQTYTPLDSYTGKLKDIAEDIRQGTEKDRPIAYSLMPRFQADAKSRYIEGKNLIGSFALSNVHHILGQIADLYVPTDLGIPQAGEQVEKTSADLFREAYDKAYELMYEYNVNGALTDEYQGYVKRVEPEEYTGYLEKAKKATVEDIPVEKLIELARLKGPKASGTDHIIPVHQSTVDFSSVIRSYGSSTLNKWAEDNKITGVSFEEAHWISENEDVASRIVDIAHRDEFSDLTLEEVAMKLLYDNDAIETLDLSQTRLYDQEIPQEQVLSGTIEQEEAIQEFNFNKFVKDYITGEIERDLQKTTNLAVHKGQDGEYVSDWMSAIISALVDIAKDPYIFDLNVNSYTQNIANFLVRAGLGDTTFYFLAQPILKDAAYYNSLTDKAGSGFSGTNKLPGRRVREIYRGLRDEAQKREQKEGGKPKPIFGGVFSRPRLRADATGNYRADSNFYNRQLEILDKFQEISKYAAALTEAVMVSRVDTRQYGKNQVEAKIYNNKYERMLDSHMLSNFKRMFTDTFLGDYMNNAIPTLKTALKDRTITSTEGFNYLHDQIMNFGDSLYTSDQNKLRNVVNYAANELYSAFAARFFTSPDFMNISRDKVKNMLIGDNTLAKRVYNLKYSTNAEYAELRTNKVIYMLTPNITEEGGFDALSANTIDIKEKWDKDEVTRAWKELLSHPDDHIKQIGKDLVVYSFFTSGFSKNPNSFFEFIPYEYLRDTGFSDFISWQIQDLNHVENYSSLTNEILDEVYRNSWYNDNLVPEIEFGAIENTFKWGNKNVVLFSVNKEATPDLHKGYNEVGTPIYQPYVKHTFGEESIMYEYIGYKSKDGTPVYRATSKLGYSSRGYKVKEYGLGESIFENNQFEYASSKEKPKSHLNIENISNLKKSGKFIYNDFVSVEKQDNMSGVSSENISEEQYQEQMPRMDSKGEMKFKTMRLSKGQKEFTVEEIQKALPDLSEQQAEVLRQGIKDGTINNNC